MARTSAMTGGSNVFQTTSEDINRIATDFISDGIVGTLTNTAGVAPMTGGLSVNAQGTPNTTTAIGAGIAYVTATPTSQASQRLAVKIDAQNVTHAANSTGATRYDWIYVKVDPTLAANPAVAGDTTGTIFVSRSTSSSTDNGTPPTYGYNIAVVTLANSFPTVTNGNIADKRVQTGAVSPTGGVTYSRLLSTIFSGQVQTLANTGSAGGTMSYINLGGIKLLWGEGVQSGSIASGGTGNQQINLPGGFFTAVTATFAGVNDNTGSARVLAYRQTPPTTSVVFYGLYNFDASAITAKMSYLVIGT